MPSFPSSSVPNNLDQKCATPATTNVKSNRSGYPEECYLTLNYSPILDGDGSVGGVLTPVHETTERVIGEPRLRTVARSADSRAGQ